MRLLQNLFSELKEFGLKPELIQTGLPELGSDLAMPCFSLAALEKKAPQLFAQELALKIKHPHVIKAQAVDGFLNLWLKSSFLAQTLEQNLKYQENLGQKKPHLKTVVIDYFGPNLAKPLSVAYLRNLFLGRAFCNFFQALGYKVIADNHVGDWGTTFGIWVVGYFKYGHKRKLHKDGLKELGRIYILMQQALKEEASLGKDELEKQVQAWVLKLEKGDKKAWQYHRLFTNISLKEMTEVLDELQIEFDATLPESFYHKACFKILDNLQKKDIAQKQVDGSLTVDLSSQGIKKPLIIQKSNGATLYATTDIATLYYRQQKWQPTKIIYVVGSEQKFHFQQLFALNQIAQITPAQLIHSAYGLLEEKTDDGKRRKMSSRHRAVYLKDVLNQAYQLAQELIHKDLSLDDQRKIAHGALIFQAFSYRRQQNILFDWQKIFSLTQMSGPYVQYTTLRLKSLLNKSKVNMPKPYFDYDWQAEHKLLFKLLSFEDVMQNALNSLDLSKIATHIKELAQELNRYYEAVRVLDNVLAVQSSRLWLIKILYEHFCFALGILGIKIPSKM